MTKSDQIIFEKGMISGWKHIKSICSTCIKTHMERIRVIKMRGSFAFLNDRKENIYSEKDGIPLMDSSCAKRTKSIGGRPICPTVRCNKRKENL